MNNRQKEVLLRELKNEEKLRKELLTVYKEAEKQVSEQIAYLEAFGDMQSKIYQLKYQKYLKLQLDKIIDALKSKQYDKLNTYIDEAYRTRFIGTLYDIQGQGVPLLFPIDEGQVIDAVMINSKISKGLYDHLQEPFEKLKETIRREVARGIATGQSVPQIATLISKKMTGSYKKPMGQYAYATRIARTEAHRVAEQAADDVRRKAIDTGAEIVKEWCSILDLHTRDDHAALNGQIRNIDEPFEIKGQQAQFPGDFGIARQDINCRCICLQRAKWAVEDIENSDLILEKDNFNDWESEYITRILADKNISTSGIFDYTKVTKSGIINMQKYEEIHDYFAEKNISLVHFEKLDVNEYKPVLCGVDDVLLDFPEAMNMIKEIRYNSRLRRSYGEAHQAEKFIRFSKQGLPKYEVGVHETAHALDYFRSQKVIGFYSDKVIKDVTSLANKGKFKRELNAYMKEYESFLSIQGYSSRDYNSEIFAHALTNIYKGIENKIDKKIYDLVKGGLL